MTKIKAVIFDRDGTLNRTTDIVRASQSAGDTTDGYVLSIEELVLLPRVKEAFARLTDLGMAAYVFTQQNCIGKGLVTRAAVDAIHAHMNVLLKDVGRIDGFYVAEHKNDPRAKPSPQMIFDILQQNRLDLAQVVVMGDSLRDYRSALAAGVDFIWIRDDRVRVSEAKMKATYRPIFDDVYEAVKSLTAF